MFRLEKSHFTSKDVKMKTEIYATIDVGSNSILLYIAEKDEQGHWTPVMDRVEVTRLAEGLQATGFLKAEAMKRTVRALSGFMALAKEQGAVQVAAVGTMCLRAAKNAGDFLQQVKNECGLTVKVISGEEEARLSFLGVKSGMNLSRGRFVIFDIGGGSTEFIFAKGEHIERKFSINIGAAGLTEKYLISNPVTKEELAMMLNAVQASFADFEADGKVDALIGIGGTLTTMGAVLHQVAVYDPDIIHGYVLSLAEIERQLELYRSKTIEARKAIVGLQPERADVILAGAGIVRTILKKFGVDAVTISDRGVRHGLMMDRFG